MYMRVCILFLREIPYNVVLVSASTRMWSEDRSRWMLLHLLQPFAGYHLILLGLTVKLFPIYQFCYKDHQIVNITLSKQILILEAYYYRSIGQHELYPPNNRREMSCIVKEFFCSSSPTSKYLLADNMLKWYVTYRQFSTAWEIEQHLQLGIFTISHPL